MPETTQATFTEMCVELAKDPMIGRYVGSVRNPGQATLYFFERWTADFLMILPRYEHRMSQVMTARPDIEATTDTRPTRK
jgi:hypothetical protein